MTTDASVLAAAIRMVEARRAGEAGQPPPVMSVEWYDVYAAEVAATYDILLADAMPEPDDDIPHSDHWMRRDAIDGGHSDR